MRYSQVPVFPEAIRISGHPNPEVELFEGPQDNCHLYKWKAGDCLASVALRFLRPSQDWKVLLELNHELMSARFNDVQEGDLLLIPKDWLPLKASVTYDFTKVEERNQDLQRESYLLKMYGQLKTYKESADGKHDQTQQL